LQAALKRDGILTNVHYPVPVHAQPAYAGRVELDPAGLVHTEAAARAVLSLPLYPELSEESVAAVIAALRRLA
jgi:dTDP-4-amino-4,6-dideoxygalactose transaminase